MDTGLKQEAPALNARTSGLATASLAFAIVSPFTCALAAIPAIILGIVSLIMISKSQGRLKGKSLAITGISISLLFILLFGGFFVLWSLDAPTIPDDYTIADLRSAPPEYNASYELLLSLSDKDPDVSGAPAIGMSEQDVNSIREISKIIRDKNYLQISDVLNANADKINQIWQSAKKGRDIINELDEFTEIADLTKPDYSLYDEPGPRDLGTLSQLYRIHVCLQVEKGNIQDAVNELNKIDSVFRKLSINARELISKKCLCYIYFVSHMNIANSIVNHPHASQESIRSLAEHFRPLTHEQLALRNQIIFEYLFLKYVYNKTFDHFFVKKTYR